MLTVAAFSLASPLFQTSECLGNSCHLKSGRKQKTKNKKQSSQVLVIEKKTIVNFAFLEQSFSQTDLQETWQPQICCLWPRHPSHYSASPLGVVVRECGHKQKGLFTSLILTSQETMPPSPLPREKETTSLLKDMPYVTCRQKELSEQ